MQENRSQKTVEMRLNGGHNLPFHGWNRVDLSAKKLQRRVSSRVSKVVTDHHDLLTH